MANIFLRSPYYITESAPVSGLSVKVVINIDGSDRYTIVKNKSATSDFLYFEISELIRDYLDIVYSTTINAATLSEVVEVTTTWYNAINAGGSVIGSPTVTTNFAIDAYGYFEQGKNPTTQQGVMVSLSEGNSRSTIYKLKGADFRIPFDLNNTDTISYIKNGVTLFTQTVLPSATQVFGYTDTSFVLTDEIDQVEFENTLGGTFTIEIKLIEECKYNPAKVTFVNKFGAFEDIYFFKKSTESIRTKSDSYKSSLSQGDGNYSILNHQKKVLNVESSKTITLNTGYIGGIGRQTGGGFIPNNSSNAAIQELMQSEQVWMQLDGVTTPMNVEESSLTFKTSLNDKLVDYTMDFSYAYDTINNIR